MSEIPTYDPLCRCGHRASKHAPADSSDTRCLVREYPADLIVAFDDGRSGEDACCACLRFTRSGARQRRQ